LRSYKNSKDVEDSAVWYLKGVSTWLRALGAAPGDSLSLELRARHSSVAAPMGMSTSGSAKSTPGTAGSTAPAGTNTADADADAGDEDEDEDAASIPPPTERAAEPHVVVRLMRARSARSRTNADRDGSNSGTAGGGERNSITHLPATAAAPPPPQHGYQCKQQQQQRRQAGPATACTNVVRVPRSCLTSTGGPEGAREAAYLLRVRWDKNLIGHKALRAAYAPQLLAAGGALPTHGSSSSSGSGSSGSSCSSCGSSDGTEITIYTNNSSSSSRDSGGTVCESQLVRLYRMLPDGCDSADDDTMALQEYAVRLYIGKPGSPGLALTRTAGLVRDLGLGPGDRLQLSLLSDGRAVVASAANSLAVVPTVVRLSDYNLKKGVYVPLAVVRQLLGPDVASITGLGVPVTSDPNSDSDPDPDLLNPSTSVLGTVNGWLRSHPGSTRYGSDRVAPYWVLTGLKAWLRACGAVPGDVMRLEAEAPARPATATAATATATATVAAAVRAAAEMSTAVVTDETDGAAAEAVTSGV
ncbi:hypothetical protein Vretimale_6306, partial [Volvox reticuliferus]